MVLERYVLGRESALIDSYIKDGPAQLKVELGLSDEEWSIVFDHLVFEANLLYKCVISTTEFFLEEYIRHGMTHVREILNVVDDRYNGIIEVVFDYLAVSREGLCYHVLQHRERYVTAMRQRGGDFVRKVLGLYKEKYGKYWEKVLNILLKAACEDIFTRTTFDDGLRAFSLIYNGTREHRKGVF